jgi:hydroxyacylglutathione hydrolase
MKHGPLIVEYKPVGPFAMNSYVIGCAETRQGAVIDSGGETDAILSRAADHELEIVKLLQTHAHIDHVAGLKEMKARTGASIYLHAADREVYRAAPAMGRFFGLTVELPPPPDEELEEGQRLSLGEVELQVLFTPGHCPGHVGFWVEAAGVYFGGDLLFRGSMGRVDLPGADPEAMRESLARILRELPDETVVYPGHMEPTTIGTERRTNPYLVGGW